MLDFFKKISTTSPGVGGAQQQSAASETIPEVILLECEKPSDFLKVNFPQLSQRRLLYNEQRKAFKGEEKQIDIAIYFKEQDKHLATIDDKNAVINKEFGGLPRDDLKTEHVNMRLEALERYDEILNNIVRDAATKNYDKFQEGINNLEFYSYTVDLCTDDIKVSKHAIKEIRNDLGAGTLRVTRLLKARNTKLKAASLLKKFKEHFKTINEVIKTLDKQNPSNAYQIIPLIKKAKQEFEKESDLTAKLECLKNCEKYFENKLDDLQRDIRQSLTNVFVEWDKSKFQSYLKCAYMLQESYPNTLPLTSKIPNIVKVGIKLARDQVIELYSQQRLSNQSGKGEKIKTIELVKNISKDMIPKFMNRLFHQMSLLMYNTHLCCRFLEEHQKDEITVELDGSHTYNLGSFYSSLKMSLLTLRKTIWQNIQKKVAKVFSHAQIQGLGYYDLLSLLQFCHTFVEIGEDFSHSSSATLKEAILNSLKNYYSSFHESSLQTIRDMISEEEWRRLPLPENYKQPVLVQLLKQFPQVQLQLQDLLKVEAEPEKIANINIKTVPKMTSALSSFVTGNPFQVQDKLGLTKTKSYMMSPKKSPIATSIEEIKPDEASSTTVEETEEDSELNGETKPENADENETIACSTANFIVKNFEKYLLLMNLVRPHALEIFTGLIQTFEFLIYAVAKNFTPPPFRNALFTNIEPDLNSLSRFKDDETRLCTLEDLHDMYLFQKSYKNLRKYMPKVLEFFDNSSVKILDEKTNDYSWSTLFGLTERSIAIESVMFIYDHIKYIQNRVSRIVTNAEQTKNVQELYQTFEKIMPEFRTFVYACFMPNLLKNENVFQPIQSVKWEPAPQEASEGPNAYTNKILYFVMDYHTQIEALDRNGLPKKVQKDLKKDVINFTYRKLIDNFSKVKKVNTLGRNMMLNDFNHITQSLADIMDPRSTEKKDFCESYIKAWFKNVDELVTFASENKDTYGAREINSLLQNHTGIKNLTRQQKKDVFNKLEADLVQFIRSKISS